MQKVAKRYEFSREIEVKPLPAEEPQRKQRAQCHGKTAGEGGRPDPLTEKGDQDHVKQDVEKLCRDAHPHTHTLLAASAQKIVGGKGNKG